MFSYIFHELFHEIHELIHKFHLQYSYSSWNNKVLLLGQIERQALKAPSKPACRFFLFFSPPSFFPPVLRALFFRALFPPSFFFYLGTFFRIFHFKSTINTNFLRIFLYALLPPSFFFISERPLFSKNFWGRIFFCALFPPSFFFILACLSIWPTFQPHFFFTPFFLLK